MDQAFERVLQRYNRRAEEEAAVLRDSRSAGRVSRDDLLLRR